MSTPDYPLLTVPGYELYQLAHLTTFVVDALAGTVVRRRLGIAWAAGPRLLSRSPPMQRMSAQNMCPHPPAGLPPRRPRCPVRELRRPTAPPGHPVTAPQPDLRPLPLHGQRRLPGRRPLPRCRFSVAPSVGRHRPRSVRCGRQRSRGDRPAGRSPRGARPLGPRRALAHPVSGAGSHSDGTPICTSVVSSSVQQRSHRVPSRGTATAMLLIAAL